MQEKRKRGRVEEELNKFGIICGLYHNKSNQFDDDAAAAAGTI